MKLQVGGVGHAAMDMVAGIACSTQGFLWANQSHVYAEIMGAPHGSGRALAAIPARLQMIDLLRCMQELCELLDIRMVEIRQRWQEGRLQAIGFRCGRGRWDVQAPCGRVP